MDKASSKYNRFLKEQALPVYQEYNMALGSTLIDNGKESTPHWIKGQYGYEIFLKKNNIRHTKIEPRFPKAILL